MKYSEAFPRALEYAATAHREQIRKGTAIPYVTHLLGVTTLVLDAGGDETEAIAAVLHDVVEDQPLGEGGGRARLADVRERFGDHVAKIVEALSDWISKDSKEKKDKSPYRERKAAYLDHLAKEQDKSVLLVSAADKLHNARAMESDFDKVGPVLWERFSATPEDTCWYYDRLVTIFDAAVPDDRRTGLVDQLAATFGRLKAKSGKGAPLVRAVARNGAVPVGT